MIKMRNIKHTLKHPKKECFFFLGGWVGKGVFFAIRRSFIAIPRLFATQIKRFSQPADNCNNKQIKKEKKERKLTGTWRSNMRVSFFFFMRDNKESSMI